MNIPILKTARWAACLAWVAAAGWLGSSSVEAADSWTAEVTKSAPKYWYRFEETDPTAPAVSQGSEGGWNGVYGPEMDSSANLGRPSVIPALGNAIEFVEQAGATTGKFVDLAANSGDPSVGVPELTNFRPPTVEKSTTVEYWIKTSQVGSAGTQTWNSPSILASESPGDGDMYWGWIESTGDFGFSTSDIGEIFSKRDSGKSVTDGHWHHIVLVKEWKVSQPSVSTMYIDGGSSEGGATIQKTTIAGNASFQDPDSGIRYLGFTEHGGNQDVQFVGLIDELAIYDRALTAQEVAAHFLSVANAVDTDGDGIPDLYETAHGLDPAVKDASGDADNDGLSNLQEYQRKTDPQVADTDGDGLKDGVETNTGAWVSASNTGTDPLKRDTDGDGLLDGVETNTGAVVNSRNSGSNPLLPDTDGDGQNDYVETRGGSNPSVRSNGPATGWAAAVAASGPRYWYRFEESDPTAPAQNLGLAVGFDGAYGPEILAGENLGKPSALPSLGSSLELNGPEAGNSTGKFVDLAINADAPDAGIPELTNFRPPGMDKTTTVEYWIKSTQRGSGGSQTWNSPAILANESGGDGDMYWGWITETGDFGFSTSDLVEIYSRRDANLTVTDGQWHHIIMIKEWHVEQPCVSTMYIDGGAAKGGATIVRTTPAGNASYQDTDGGIRYLGFTQHGGNQNVQFIGNIDELAIYDRALTEEEAGVHFAAVANADTDGDGIPDLYEIGHGLNPGVNDTASDLDNDGATNLAEFQNKTDPQNSDTDGDGLKDGAETNTGTWVGATNTGTNPLNPDTDADGLKDGVETNTGTFVSATNTGTSPLSRDSDNDGFDDAGEIITGSNPTDIGSIPKAGTWVEEITRSAPSYWYRFEETDPGAPADNRGSVEGFDGIYGPEITAADLGKSSVLPALGSALEFTGPEAGVNTGKYVDFGASIPELINVRGAAQNKSTTVEYWIRTSQRGSAGTQTWNSPALLAHESGGDGDMYWGWIIQDGDFGFSTSDFAEIFAQRDGGKRVTDGQWHHIVLIKQWRLTEPNTSIMYVDGGSLEGGATITRTTPAGDASFQDSDGGIQYLGFTQSGGSGNLQYIGLIDELAIYNRALSEAEVRLHYRSVTKADSDNDGIPDSYELSNGMNPNVADSNQDADNDGLTNLAEFQKGTNPQNADTDGDGLKDGVETGTGTWVSATNTGTDPFDADTDDDGLLDGVETNTGAFVSATNTGTNPFNADTDNDSIKDSDEVSLGTNPTSGSSNPSVPTDWVTAVRADAPRYWWRFEESAPTSPANNEGSIDGFDGTYGSGITAADLNKPSATPRLGKALELTGPAAGTGTTKFVDFGADIPELINLRDAPEDGKATTVEYWIKTGQRGSVGSQTWNSPSIFAHESGGDGDMYWGWFTQDGRFGLSTSDITEIYSSEVSDGQWHHVVLVKEWNLNKPSFSAMYIDGGALSGGQTFEATTPPGSLSFQDGDSGIQFLGYTESGGSGDLQYIGLIDEVAIYSKRFREANARIHFLAGGGQIPVNLMFNQPVLNNGQVTISWVGNGILQEASELTGKASDWKDVNPQPAGNSITIPASGDHKFYRLRSAP